MDTVQNVIRSTLFHKMWFIYVIRFDGCRQLALNPIHVVADSPCVFISNSNSIALQWFSSIECILHDENFFFSLFQSCVRKVKNWKLIFYSAHNGFVAHACIVCTQSFRRNEPGKCITNRIFPKMLYIFRASAQKHRQMWKPLFTNDKRI